ncbi:glycoside hydrolase family 3 protein, partial [Streptomyces sp. NPDC005921]
GEFGDLQGAGRVPHRGEQDLGAVRGAGRYGIGGATVRAVAAGADAVCVGGENAEEATVGLLVDTLADAVRSGDLPEERLVTASRRVREFAAWSAGLTPVGLAPWGDGGIGFAAARRAIRLTGAVRHALPLVTAPHVVELAPATNLAIGKETPWGVAAPLGERLPGTTSVRVRREDLQAHATTLQTQALAPAAGRPLVVVVRDAARHKWMARALADLLAARPDAIVVEMGLPGTVVPSAAQIFTHGATAASGVAAAEVLAGAL